MNLVFPQVKTDKCFVLQFQSQTTAIDKLCVSLSFKISI